MARNDFATFGEAMLEAAHTSWCAAGKAMVVALDHDIQRFSVWFATSLIDGQSFCTVVATVMVPDNVSLDLMRHSLKLVEA